MTSRTRKTRHGSKRSHPAGSGRRTYVMAWELRNGESGLHWYPTLAEAHAAAREQRAKPDTARVTVTER